ncbi:hypothetical protein D3C73_1096360 [compost metagenome]
MMNMHFLNRMNVVNNRISRLDCFRLREQQRILPQDQALKPAPPSGYAVLPQNGLDEIHLLVVSRGSRCPNAPDHYRYLYSPLWVRTRLSTATALLLALNAGPSHLMGQASIKFHHTFGVPE